MGERVRVYLGQRELAEDPCDVAVRAFVGDNLMERLMKSFAVVAIEIGVLDNHHLRHRIPEDMVRGAHRPHELGIARI